MKSAVLVSLFAAAYWALLAQASWWRAGLEMDEGMTLMYPELILDGRVPQRDFETFYPPGNLWLLAGGYAVGGPSLATGRAAGLLCQTAILAGIAVLAWPAGPLVAIGGAALAASALAIIGLTPFAWVNAFAPLVWAVVLAAAGPGGRWGRWRGIGVGLLCAATITFRQDLLAAVAGILAWSLWRRRWEGWPWLAAGFAAGLLPLAAHTWVAGFASAWDQMVTRPVFEARAGRTLPLSAMGASDRIFASVVLAAICFNAAAAFRAWRGGRERVFEALALGTIVSAGALPQMLQRSDSIHIAFCAFVPFGLMPLAASVFRDASGKAWASAAAVAVPAAILGAMFLTPFPEVTARRVALAASGSYPTFPVSANGRIFFARSPRVMHAAQGVVDFLAERGKAGERVIVGAWCLSVAMCNDTFLYHLLYPKFVPGTYFLEMNPGSANRDGTVLAEEVTRADWVILNSVFRSWNEPNTSVEPGDQRADASLKEHFRIAARSGPFLVLCRKDRPGIGETTVLGSPER